MTKYPNVLGEVDTLAAVIGGRSLARYGDGEFALVEGRAIKCQPCHKDLSYRLDDILNEPGPGECLVGIPNINSRTPKIDYWKKYAPMGTRLSPDRTYVSAFVTRPDSAPWVNTPGYWMALESLWVGQNVTLVRGNERSLTAADLIGAERVTEIIGPAIDAWSQYEQIRRRALATMDTRVLLCLGPTATVLAVELARHGRHAIDLGHVGMFLKKYRRGEPMTVTALDRAS